MNSTFEAYIMFFLSFFFYSTIFVMYNGSIKTSTAEIIYIIVLTMFSGIIYAFLSRDDEQ